MAVNLPVRGNVMTGRERILSMPRACVYLAAASNILTTTVTPIGFDSILYDTDGMFTASASTKLTARTAGVYLFNAWMAYASNAAGYRQLYFWKNGASPYAQLNIGANPASGTYMVISAQIAMNAGDSVELNAVQNSGGTLAVNVATATDLENAFQACLIST